MNLAFTDRELKEGRRLLKSLIAGIRREISLADADGVLQPTTLLGQSMMSRIRMENLDALVVRRSAGGWHADVVLTGMPTGVSNVMGTPEAIPLPDREQALRAGTEILRQLCRLALENAVAGRDTRPQDTRPFVLHGHTFQIPGPVVDQIGQIWAAVGRDLIPDAERARANLTESLVRTMGSDRFDPDLYDRLAEEDRGRIAINMATLLLFGEFRHPERPQAVPVSEEGPHP
jgi:hypothetical protein